MTASRPDPVILGLLGVAAVLLLANLDNGYLWQDEAETAVLARHTLRFGYPRLFDGRSWVEVTWLQPGPGDSWVYSPWLPFYILAGVFAVAGESTWVARLPFALCGLLSALLTWRLARRLTPDRTVQRLSVALLVCSVPFLLHMRQCRYYAMVTALMLALCLAYLAFLRDPRTRRAWAVAGLLVLLFHTNFGTFIPACAAVLAHQARWGSRASRRQALRMALPVLALTLPWALLHARAEFIGAFSWARAADHLEYYVRVTNKHLIPLAAMLAGTGALLLVRRRSRVPAVPLPPPAVCWFLALVVAAQGAFLLLPDQRHLRYLIPVLPVLLLVEASWLAAWLRCRRPAGVALIGLALWTTVLQTMHPRVPLADFLDELTHRYTGPMEGVVGYLRAHGAAGQSVKIPYDDRTLIFYTDLTIERPSTFLEDTGADWVVVRRDWMPAGFDESAVARRLRGDYDRIELAVPDVRWQNREDPGEHHFRTVQGAPPMVLYRKSGPPRGGAPDA